MKNRHERDDAQGVSYQNNKLNKTQNPFSLQDDEKNEMTDKTPVAVFTIPDCYSDNP